MLHDLPHGVPPPATHASDDEALLVRALRNRDEAAFSRVLDRHYAAMLRVAKGYVGSEARAEEVVQETWLAVLDGVDRFEQRSSLRTWIFRILINRAKTQAVRDARLVPVSSLPGAEGAQRDPAAGLAAGAGWPLHAGGEEGASPEDRLLAEELRRRIDEAVDALPKRQREVITLRDVEGWSSEDVCNTLGLSATNQRVLLHRARVGVRNALAGYLDENGD
jgi:RNA polymerase sigma-70 factor, ECF subfamily